MRVEIHLYTQSEPIVREAVCNAYQKGDMYCVMVNPGEVEKYPLIHIFRTREIE